MDNQGGAAYADDLAAGIQTWKKRFIEVRIVDQAGQDPIAPPKVEMLFDVAAADDGRVLQLYFNTKQFLSIPVFDRTLTDCSAKLLRSIDEQAKLVYEVQLI